MQFTSDHLEWAYAQYAHKMHWLLKESLDQPL